jgi:RNA polymerase sigma-70 factor (ECF subfamily)
MFGDTTIRIQNCLDRLTAGEATAKNELIEHARRRLDHLARKVFSDFPKLKRWVDSDDVLQNACLRLSRSVAAETPAFPREYFRLAALQIRRELLDLVRHYYGPQGLGANHSSGDGDRNQPTRADHSSLDPAHLAEWTELHDVVANLPDDEREVFDLLWYHGLSQPEVARLLNLSLRTVKRCWQRSRLTLHRHLSSCEESSSSRPTSDARTGT